MQRDLLSNKKRVNKQTNKQIHIFERFVPDHVFSGTNYAIPRVELQTHTELVLSFSSTFILTLSNRHAS